MAPCSGADLRRRVNVSCGIMFALYGYDAGVLGGVLSSPQFLNSLGNPAGQYAIPMVASAYTLAAFFATPIVMVFGMRTGRKKLLLLGNILVVVGGAIQASSYSVAQISVARIICGFGIGFISSTIPAYQNEMSIDRTTRGRDMAMTAGVYLIGGIPLAYWLDYACLHVKSSFGWRFPIACQIIPATVSLVMFANCPDSPRWLYAVHREGEGDDVLARLHGKPIDHPEVAAEKLSIYAVLDLENSAPKLRLRDFLWDRTELKTARRLVICFLTLSFQQLMSVNFLVYYSTIIFSSNGLDANISSILGAVLNTVYWFGTFPTVFLIDRWGRRPLMLYSAIICTVLMAIFVVLLGLPDDQQTIGVKWAASAFIIVYFFFFGIGWNAPPWTYAPEIAPLEHRHLGAALNASGEWLWSFVTVFASPIAVSNPAVGWRIWFWYLAFNFLAIPFVYFCCPETSGRTLEELDVLFCQPEIRERILNERSDLRGEADRRAAEKLGMATTDIRYDPTPIKEA